jgi:DNA-directed RNA polymerase specialized sigma54-like protein
MYQILNAVIMKKFLLMLLVAGVSGFTRARELFPVDVDVGYPAQQASARYMTCPNIKTIRHSCKKIHYDLKTLNEINYTDKGRESQSLTAEAGILNGFVPFVLIENADEKFHHLVHTHDVPNWNILRNYREACPNAQCRSQRQTRLPDNGMSGHQLLPILTERTAP